MARMWEGRSYQTITIPAKRLVCQIIWYSTHGIRIYSDRVLRTRTPSTANPENTSSPAHQNDWTRTRNIVDNAAAVNSRSLPPSCYSVPLPLQPKPHRRRHSRNLISSFFLLSHQSRFPHIRLLALSGLIYHSYTYSILVLYNGLRRWPWMTRVSPVSSPDWARLSPINQVIHDSHRTFRNKILDWKKRSKRIIYRQRKQAKLDHSTVLVHPNTGTG